MTDIVRAAHFGHFELLIVHFDLDDTLLDVHQHVSESARWIEIRKEVDDLLVNQLANAGVRTASLHTIFMTPAQSTDAWLRWALLDGDGDDIRRAFAIEAPSVRRGPRLRKSKRGRQPQRSAGRR